MALTVVVTGLLASTSYDFDIVASNAAGTATSAIVSAATNSGNAFPAPGNVAGSQNTGSAVPKIVGPQNGAVNTGVSLAITGVTITDAGATSGTLVVTCSAGTLRMTLSGNAVTGSGTASITLADTFANCQAALSTLTYTAPSSAIIDTINITFNDQALGATLQPPPQAAAAGYNLLTHGSNVTIGTNWFINGIQTSYLGSDSIQNADGSVTIGTTASGALTTIHSASGPTTLTGVAFGGGAYMEATFKVLGGAINTSHSSWPAFWCNDVEIQATIAVTPTTQWQGQASNYGHWIEVDIAEFDVNATTTTFGSAIHDWYGTIGSGLGVSAPFTTTTLPAPGTIGQLHKYGFLWIPATATTKGRASFYVDDVLYQTTTWDQFNPSNPPPPVLGTSAFSVMDVRHLYPIFSTGPDNPITVVSANVWQASAANNISTLSLPSPTPIGAAPAIAAGVGYNTLTYGPNVTLDTNWTKFSFFGASINAFNITQNPDGSVTLNPGGSTYGGHLCSAQIINGNSTNRLSFNGTAFGGGGFFEADMAIQGPASFWANDIESMNGASIGLGVNPWLGQTQPYGDWIEVDMAEFDTTAIYGAAMHNWYSTAIPPAIPPTIDAVSGSPFTPSPTPDYTKRHKYGFLWVPATGSAAPPANLITNSALAGAIVGTPGTLPTGWFFPNTAGLSFSVTATGTNATTGFHFIRLRVFGTSTGGDCNFGYVNPSVAGKPSWNYTLSTYISMFAGSMTNITSLGLIAVNLDNGGGYISGSLFKTFTPTGTVVPYTGAFVTDPSTVKIGSGFSLLGTIAGPVDITLQIENPQLLEAAVPSGAQGYGKFFFDGVQVGNTMFWNKYNPNAAPPPAVSDGSATSVLDSLHLALILGTGVDVGNSNTVYSVTVWQASAANNIGPPQPSAPVGNKNTLLVQIQVGAVAAPVAPSVPVVTPSAATSSSVQLSWGASTGTTPITYQPQFKLHTASAFAAFGSAISGLSVTVTGLTASASYDFQVVATNTAGSVTSATVTASTTSASVAPSAPTNVQAIANTATSITFSWATPSTGTAPITFQPMFRQTGATVTTKWYENPGQDGGYWKQPFYSTAQWVTSGAQINALRNSNGTTPFGSVNQKGNFSVPFVIGTASDPLVQVTDGTRSINVRIPLGTIAETPTSGVDQSIGGCDATQPYLVWSISGATINTTSVQASGSVITGTYGFAICDGTGQFMCDAVTGMPGSGNSFGLIQDLELTRLNADPNYVIPHMLTYQLDPRYQSSTSGPVWPLLIIDTSATNVGILPQGQTIGIPASTVRPVGKTRGFYAWWDVLQQYGAIMYNLAASGGINFSIYSNLSANNALVADMVSSLSAVIGSVCILSNQTGLSSVKGFAPGGVSSFPPPPILDLSPTGGQTVLPSTFGAWYNPSPAYNVKAPVPTGGAGVAFAPFGSAISTTSVTVTGLTANTSYDFEVVATNSFGSATSVPVTASTGTTGIPSDLSGTRARPAQDMLNRFGINTHFGNGLYQAITPAQGVAAVQFIGATLIRDSDNG